MTMASRCLASAVMLLVACAPSPEAPLPLPAGSRPPAPAGGCDIVRQDYAGYYWFSDLETGRSCRVYLEQDDCVVAIFDDCTWPDAWGDRQWTGRVARVA